MRRRVVLLLTALLVSLPVAGVSPGAAAAAPMAGGPATSSPATTASLPEPAPRQVGDGKIESRLLQVIDSGQADGERAGLARAQAVGVPVSGGGDLRVIVETADDSGARAAVAASGAKVERSAGDLLQVLASPAQLSRIASSSAVSYVRPPMTRRAEAVDGEGVAVTNALRLQQMAGVTGAGVKVAIVDLGFAKLDAAQASGDLPASLTKVDYCGGQFSLGTEHGTAVSEIVHEMAPDAVLYLICVDTEVELASAELYAKQNGISVVNHSVGWFDTSRGDGKGGAGTPDATVADAAANGILWVNSAGNYATEHWSGNYSDANVGGVHWNKFAANPVDTRNTFHLQAGEEVCALLKWDAWPKTKQDFDLYIGIVAGGYAVAGSTNAQYPYNLAPVEETCYTNSGAAADFFVSIQRYNATTSPRMDLYLLDADPTYHTAAGSVVEPASSPNAFAAGAVAYNSSAIEPFSSRGPTIDNRTKPDISGPDGVSGTTYGPNAFYGTSSASPHLAGAAALVKSMFPSYSPKQIRSYLQSSARDLGSSGPDNSFGSGLVHLPGPPTAPTAVTATPYHQSAFVSWTAPADSGGSTVTGYVVMAAPGGATCSTSGQTSCTVTGLNDSTDYTFTVAAVNVVGTGDASGPSPSVTPLAVPSAPSVAASFDGTNITVTWTAADGHGSSIGDYDVAVAGFADCHTTGLSCQFGPTTASFTGAISVVATNGTGAGPAGRLTFAARAGDSYVPLLPSRVIDTAKSTGSILAPATMGKLTAWAPVEFQVANRFPSDPAQNVPANAVAVTAELEISNASYSGWLALTPAETTSPTTSNLNFLAGDSRAAGVTVPLSAGGTLWVIYGSPKSGQKTDFALDVTGYFVAGADGATYHALTPNRIVDSRPNDGLIVNTGLYTNVIRGVPRSFKVTERVPSDTSVNVPAGSVALVGNLTVTNQTAAGFFSLGAYPDFGPNTGTLYFPKGDNRASGVTALIAPDGTLSMSFTSSTPDATADVIFDVSGYYSPDTGGALYIPLAPNRLLDSRKSIGFRGPLYQFRAYTFQVTNRTPSNSATNVPLNAVAVTGTLTVTQQSCGGFLALTTNPIDVPATSTLNFPLRDDRANGVTVPLSATGTLSVTYGAPGTNHTHAVFDVTGYFVN